VKGDEVAQLYIQDVISSVQHLLRAERLAKIHLSRRDQKLISNITPEDLSLFDIKYESSVDREFSM